MRAVSQIRATAVTLAVAAALLAVSCGSEPTPTPTPTITAEDVRDRAADALRDLSTVHFRVTHEEGGTDIGFSSKLTEAEGDGLFPDKASLVAKATTAFFGDATVELDVVQYGETTYLRDRISMVWQDLPQGTLAINFVNINGSIADALASIGELGLADGGALQGAPVHKLTGTTPSTSMRGLVPGAPEGGTLHMEVWIGQEDNLVRKVRLTGPLVDADPPDITRVLELSRFDEPVSIEPPA
ncbi:MAG: LppX_LprAFG lipoprotein [Chloroflexota bacterium]|nr:LppX_LprAFG lipoprotein [Chloroflexota bacterium]MDE2883551.1 LppX_LprAFG lipoprotein [Chloroflexota bacterium]